MFSTLARSAALFASCTLLVSAAGCGGGSAPQAANTPSAAPPPAIPPGTAPPPVAPTPPSILPPPVAPPTTPVAPITPPVATPVSPPVAPITTPVQPAPVQPPPAPSAGVASVWQYGSGSISPDASQVVSFTPLPHYDSDKMQYQGGPKYPDPGVGWVQVSVNGGHPGSANHLSILRFTAPRKGALAVTADLIHRQNFGDGVRGRLIVSRKGKLGEWRAFNTTTSTNVVRIDVEPGDTLDFVGDLFDNGHGDKYEWSPTLTMVSEGAPGVAPDARRAWNAAADFRTPTGAPAGTDLLALIDPARDNLRNNAWTREGAALVTPGQGMALVNVPFDLPPGYVLTLTAERLSGSHFFQVAPVCGDRRCHLFFDMGSGGADRRSALERVQGKAGLESGHVYRQPLFQPNTPVTLSILVEPGKIRVEQDGQRILDWQGAVSDLSTWEDHNLPSSQRLIVGSKDAAFRITHLTLRGVQVNPAQIAAASGPAGSNEPEAPRTLNDKVGYSVAFPRHWHRRPDGIPSAMSITVRDDRSAVLETAVNRTYAEWARNYVNAQPLEVVDLTLDGVPAKCQYALARGARHHLYTAIKEGRVLQMSIGCVLSSYDACRPDMDKTAQSFRFEARSEAALAGREPQAAPDQAALQAAEREMKKQFNFVAARSAEQRQALARDLLEAGRTAKDAAAQYALLDEAANLAAGAGDITTAVEAAEALGEYFTLPELERRATALTAAARAAAPPHLVAAWGLAMTYEAINLDNYKLADQVLSAAQSAARKSENNHYKKLSLQLGKDLRALEGMHARAKDGLAALDQGATPADGQAAGAYLVHAKGDFVRGVPLLAQAPGGPLKTLAERDLAAPAEAAQRLQLGEDWLAVANKEEGLVRDNLTNRALYWFELAQASAIGIVQKKAQSRVKELGAYRRPGSQVAGSDAAWDPERTILKGTLTGHGHTVRSVAFSTDGKLLASASYDGLIKIWDMPAGTLKKTIEPQVDSLAAVVFLPDGKTVLTGSVNGKVEALDVVSGKSKPVSGSQPERVYGMCLSPDGRVLATAGPTAVRVWDVASLKIKHEYPGAHPGGSLRVAFSLDGKTLISGGNDSTIKLWNGRLLKATLTGHTATITALAVSPDGTHLASAAEDGSVRVWDLASRRPVWTLRDFRSTVHSLAFSQESKYLACGAVTGAIVDLSTGKTVATLTGESEAIMSIAYSPTAQIMACAAADKTIRLWGP